MSDLYLLKSALRDMVRVKKMVAVVLVVLLPSLIALLERYSRHGDQIVTPEMIYNSIAETMVFGFILVLLAVVFCSDVIAQEVEQKTIVYLLTRPVPRWRILLMKFAATIIATTVAVSAAALLLALVTYGPAGLVGSRLGRDLLIAPVGVLAYGGLFLLLATLINRPMIYGLLFAFGWETWAPSLPGNFKMVSLMAYVRTLAPHPSAQSAAEDVSQALSTAGQSVISNHLAWIVLTAVSLLTLLLALTIFSIKEYVPREDAE